MKAVPLGGTGLEITRMVFGGAPSAACSRRSARPPRGPNVHRGLLAVGEAGLVYDLLVRPAQLPPAIRAARDLPGMRFLLDHGGNPDIAHGRLEPWGSLWLSWAYSPTSPANCPAWSPRPGRRDPPRGSGRTQAGLQH